MFISRSAHHDQYIQPRGGGGGGGGGSGVGLFAPLFCLLLLRIRICSYNWYGMSFL